MSCSLWLALGEFQWNRLYNKLCETDGLLKELKSGTQQHMHAHTHTHTQIV